MADRNPLTFNVGTFGPTSPEASSRQGTAKFRPTEEIGRTGLKQWGGYVYEEWLTELQGRRGAEMYREMADQDPVIGGILFCIEMLARNVTWWFEPGGSEQIDLQAKAFAEQCYFEDMSVTWSDLISEILTMLPYGYAWFECVYKRRGGDVRDPARKSKFTDGKIGLRKLSIRSQDSLLHWDFDPNGGIQAMVQQPPPTFDTLTVPIEKSLLFRTKIVKNNPEGRSILRNSVRPYYFMKNLQNIEGIGVERDLAGYPVLQAPPGVNIWGSTPGEKKLFEQAQAFITGVRRDELEGAVIPDGWVFTLLKGGGSRAFSTNEIITRYEQRVATSMLGDVVLLGQDKVGSYALAGTKKGILSACIEAFLDSVCSVFNTYETPRLFKLNGFKGLTDWPKLCHGPVEDVDLETIAALLTAMGAAGAPVFGGDVEDKLQNALLDKMGLPQMEADDTSEGE